MTLAMKIGIQGVVLAGLLMVMVGVRSGLCGDFEGNPRMEEFIQSMVSRHGLEEEALRKALMSAKLKESILRAMETPAEAKPWWAYRPILVNSRNIQGGRSFLRKHLKTLKRAENDYGIPGALITAILGVETGYGQNKGSFRVLDSLATLAFAYPRRADFFASELEAFFLMVKEEGLDPTTLKGSYAGAMGYPQFMPSSFLRYAVDFDHDGRKDIWNSVPDAIGSVANYFANYGYDPTQPVAVRAVLDPQSSEIKKEILENGVEPAFSLETLKNAGFQFRHESLNPMTKAGIFELEGFEGPEYWLALPNFWVITRYNKSRLYAMAVFELARFIHGSQGPSIPLLTRSEPRLKKAREEL